MQGCALKVSSDYQDDIYIALRTERQDLCTSLVGMA
jgi:hypothetical protein